MAQPDVTRRADVDASSERVVDAARKFGSAQADAAEAWVELAKVYAVAGKVPSGEALLQQEVGLFTDCLLDGDADKCKELDAALRELLALLETQGNGDFIVRSATAVQLKVVAARVCAAATPFGAEQALAAAAWVQQALEASPSSGLMEKRVALFDGCSTIDAGSGSCEELEGALEEMTTVLAQQCESKGVDSLPLSESATAGAVAEVPEVDNNDNNVPEGLTLKAAAPAGFEWGATF